MAAETWDALVPSGRAPLRHAFLTACAHVELPDFRYRPLRVGDGQGPIAAQAPAYLYDFDLGLFLGGRATRALASIRVAKARFGTVRVLELGCPAALANPFCLSSRTDGASLVDALGRLAIAEATRARAGLVIVRDIEPQHAVIRQTLGGLGFAPVPMPATHVLHVRHDTFDDFLGAMRASYRRRAHEVLWRARTLRCEFTRDFGELAPELARLWHSVYSRAQEVRREVLPAAFFRAVSDVPGTGALLLRRGDGSVASFGLLLEDRPWLRFLYTGFELASQEEGAYFRLLYEIVRLAIERRYRHVELGLTSAGPKLAIGAEARSLEAWIHHRHRAVHHLLVRSLRTLLAPHGPREASRRVFRDAPAPPTGALPPGLLEPGPTTSPCRAQCSTPPETPPPDRPRKA